MAQSRYYTPQLEPELITALFYAAKARRMPMTRLASSLVRDGLARLKAGEEIKHTEDTEAAPRP